MSDHLDEIRCSFVDLCIDFVTRILELMAWESPLKRSTAPGASPHKRAHVEELEELHARHQAASCCTGNAPLTPVLVTHAEMSYNSIIIVTPRNKPTVLQNSNKEQRAMLAACGCWCFTPE